MNKRYEEKDENAIKDMKERGIVVQIYKEDIETKGLGIDIVAEHMLDLEHILMAIERLKWDIITEYEQGVMKK